MKGPALARLVFACFAVPLFPLAARLRSEPELRQEAVVLCEGNGNASRVVAATRAARRAGIRPGFTLPQARALLPKLVARARDPESERAAQEALLDAAALLSPRVEETGPGLVTLDVSGLERQFASPFEREIGHALLQSASHAGLPARVGLAASKLAARVAASLPGPLTVVPAGEEARFLAPLPVDRLAPELEVAAKLARWGIRAIGDLVRLPAAEVTSRLGEAGRQLLASARGDDPRPLQPRRPPPDFSEGMELEWPLVTLEPFLGLAQGALERLVARLSAEALSCAKLTLALRLEPEGHDVRAFHLPAPTRDVKTLLRLTRLELERKLPGAAVAAFAFTAEPDRPRLGQLTLFGPAELSPDRLATTLSRLLSVVGEGNLGAPEAVDGHLPERFALAPYSPPAAPLTRRPGGGRGLLSVRVLRPAVELEVLTEEEPAGARLLSLRSAAGSLSIRGTVRVASGPWQLEEGWWSEAPVARDYWDVELAGGDLYRIYRERASGSWFADGVYD